MTITLNGKNHTLNEPITLKVLIHTRCQNPQCVIAEVNEQIIKREQWENTNISQNDSIELITFVGGG